MPPENYCESYQKKPRERLNQRLPKNQSEAKASDILASERVAYYTEILAIFTGVLSGFGLLQIYFLIRSDSTARTAANAGKIAADAAKKSSDALPNVERAYLFYVLSDWNCTPDAHYTSGMSQKRIHGGKLQSRGCFINHGKTPAIIHEIRIGIKRSSEPLDPTEWAAQPNQITRELFVSGGGGETRVFDSDETDWLSNEEADLVIAGGLFIYVFGCATYSDVFGETHETQFCFRFNRTTLEQWGGVAHNRRT